MSEEKFTPGKWEIEERSAHSGSYSMYGFSIMTNKHRICMCQTDDDRNIPQMKANAHLISAAPEMYALLKMIADPTTFMGAQTCEELRTAINAVLKKARGEA